MTWVTVGFSAEATRSLQVDARFHQLLVLVVRDGEPDALADDLHVAVIDIDAGDNARELFVASDAHEPAEELGAEALALRSVGDQNGELRVVR